MTRRDPPGYGFLSENADFAERWRKAARVRRPSGDHPAWATGGRDPFMKSHGVPCVRVRWPRARTRTRTCACARHRLPGDHQGIRGGGGRACASCTPSLVLNAIVSRRPKRARFRNDQSTWRNSWSGRAHRIPGAGGRARQHHPPGRARLLDAARHQKVLEEAPAPGITPRQRRFMGALREACRAVVTVVPAPWSSCIRTASSTSSR